MTITWNGFNVLLYLNWTSSDTWGDIEAQTSNNGAVQTYDDGANQHQIDTVDLNLGARDVWYNASTSGALSNQGIADWLNARFPENEWVAVLYQGADGDETGGNHNLIGSRGIPVKDIDFGAASYPNEARLVLHNLGSTNNGDDDGATGDKVENAVNDHTNTITYRYDDAADSIYIQFESGAEYLLDNTITNNADLKAFFEGIYDTNCFDFGYDVSAGIIEVRWVSTCDAGTWTYSISLSDEITLGDSVSISVMRHWPLTRNKWLQ